MTTETTNDQIRRHLAEAERRIREVFYEHIDRVTHVTHVEMIEPCFNAITALKPLVEAKLDAEEAAEAPQDPPTEGGQEG